MNFPILDFFDEPGLIGKQKYMIEEKINMLKQNKINTALFIFTKEFDEIYNNQDIIEDFYTFGNASGAYKCYIYNKKFIIAIAPVGAPAAGTLMEVLGFMGINNFFACGSCGKICYDIDSDNFLLIEKAIRGEGTSYHYQKPSIYTETNKTLTSFIAKYLKKNNLPYIKGTTWTTDSFLRETKSEVELRNSQGAIGVEMECAAWCSIAKYRKYKFAQLLYFSDTVQKQWNLHSSIKEVRKKIILLMTECVEEFVNSKK